MNNYKQHQLRLIQACFPYNSQYLLIYWIFFYLVFSEFSSHDSVVTGGTVPIMSAMSVLSPLRSSVTLANMSNITDTLENQSFFLDEFSSQRSPAMSRW